MRPQEEFPHGDEWEKWVNTLLITRFGDDGYQPIPAKVQGDAGLEGFAKSKGNAYQSYSPYQSYSTKERTEGIKRKIRDDINKLMTKGTEIQKLIGSKKISNWILVVPKLEAKECIAQAQKYEAMVIAKGLSYISHDFKVLIHDEASFLPEINFILNSYSGQLILDNDFYSDDDMKTLEKDSYSVANLARKCRLAYGEKNHLTRVSEHLKNAARKKNIIANLKKVPTQFEMTFKIKKSQEAKHQLFSSSTVGHAELLNTRLKDIEDDFKSIPALDITSARTVCMGTLAEWLMDCHIDFE